MSKSDRKRRKKWEWYWKIWINLKKSEKFKKKPDRRMSFSGVVAFWTWSNNRVKFLLLSRSLLKKQWPVLISSELKLWHNPFFVMSLSLWKTTIQWFSLREVTNSLSFWDQLRARYEHEFQTIVSVFFFYLYLFKIELVEEPDRMWDRVPDRSRIGAG